MLTKIDLCSMAALKLGEGPIQSLNDDTAAAQLGRMLFEPTIETLLAMHPWRFACRKFDLARTNDGDFVIPADVLRVLKCDGQIIGNKVLYNGDSLVLWAIVRVPVEQFPSYFVTLAVTKLAMEFCIPLVGEQTVLRMLLALYESELQAAKFIDSTISVGSDIADFSLISSRF